MKKGRDLPINCKNSIVCLIYEGKGEWYDPGNYRGISLLSALGKTRCSILAGRLKDWLMDNEILCSLQAWRFYNHRKAADNIFFL
jgi:hypothetical protein